MMFLEKISGLAVEAVVHDDALHEMCSALRSGFDASQHHFQLITGNPIQSIIFDTTMSKSAMEKYIEHYSTVDLWAVEVMRKPPRSVVVSEELVPHRVFLDSEIYNDFIRPDAESVEHLILLTEPLGSSGQVALSLLRTATERPFDSTDKRQLARLAPTLRRLIRARMLLREVLAEKQVGFAGLDALNKPILIVDAGGSVQFANQAAQGLATRTSPDTRVTRIGDLGLWCGAGQRQVADAVHAVIAGTAPSRQVVVSTPSGSPRVVDVLRLPDQTPAVSRRFAMLMMKNPGTCEAPNARLLIRLYGLTNAEANVAVALANGITVRDYAIQHSLSLETVRTQLKSSYRKLGVARQSDLVRILLALGS